MGSDKSDGSTVELPTTERLAATPVSSFIFQTILEIETKLISRTAAGRGPISETGRRTNCRATGGGVIHPINFKIETK